MLESKEGQKIPEAKFRVKEDGNWRDLSTDELFKGKTVVLFSLPGAFTPTCSGSHVPRFNDLADVFKQNGVDEILCVSVNDCFVMNEWKKTQHADKVRFIPDGNCDFTEKMGMLVDKSDLGFGKRSWRYSMLVKDGVIEKMFIEPDVPGDPYEVSDADTMLDYINPKAKKPEYITMFTREGCSFCAKAEKLLKEKGLQYEEIMLDDKITNRTLEAVSGARTTPQVFIGGKLIGGSEELEKYISSNY